MTADEASELEGLRMCVQNALLRMPWRLACAGDDAEIAQITHSTWATVLQAAKRADELLNQEERS